MNKLCCLIIMFFTCRICEGQNLVPNGDFEQYIGCPTGIFDFSVSTWINPAVWSLGGGSPDYFNQCNTSSAGVPVNNFGYQNAHSGVGYCGLIPWALSPINYREYIEVPLTSTLISNQCYQFNMYVNLSNLPAYTTDDIQVYFSNTLISGVSNHYPLPFVPQLSNTTGMINDTLNWVLISGNYQATGGESHLIIGNFLNDSNTTVQFIDSSIFNQVYIYIDDVSLTLIPPCNTGLNELNINTNTSANIYPNPAIDKLHFTIANNELSEISLYDVASRKILQQNFTNSITLNTEQLAKGIYIYEVRNKNGVIKKGKVVKD